MNVVQSKDFPPGTVIVPTGEVARYTSFWSCWDALQVPPGTVKRPEPGVNIAGNLNEALRHRRGEWVFFMGDDHTFSPDLIRRLWGRMRDRDDIDIVAPLCLQREINAFSLWYRYEDETLQEINRIRLLDLPPDGLMPIDNAGGAGLLVKTEVFRKVEPPYWFEVGKIVPDRSGEDMAFLDKARAVGFRLWGDTETRIVHVTPMGMKPAVMPDGKWGVELSTGASHFKLSLDAETDWLMTRHLG